MQYIHFCEGVCIVSFSSEYVYTTVCRFCLYVCMCIVCLILIYTRYLMAQGKIAKATSDPTFRAILNPMLSRSNLVGDDNEM